MFSYKIFSESRTTHFFGSFLLIFLVEMCLVGCGLSYFYIEEVHFDSPEVMQGDDSWFSYDIDIVRLSKFLNSNKTFYSINKLFETSEYNRLMFRLLLDCSSVNPWYYSKKKVINISKSPWNGWYSLYQIGPYNIDARTEFRTAFPISW